MNREESFDTSDENLDKSNPRSSFSVRLKANKKKKIKKERNKPDDYRLKNTLFMMQCIEKQCH